MDRRRSFARKQVIQELDQTVTATVEFFMHARANLRDGDQSAREVISHLVFWHRDYARVANALAHNRTPRLLTGNFRDWNTRATEIYAPEVLSTLARRLQRAQRKLHRALVQIPNWRVNFPLKENIAFCSVSQHVPQIRAHMAGHLLRLERAERKTGK